MRPHLSPGGHWWPVVTLGKHITLFSGIATEAVHALLKTVFNHVEYSGLKLVIVIPQSLCTGFTGICHQAWFSDLVFHRKTYYGFPVCSIFIFWLFIYVMHRECFLLCLPNHFSVVILKELEILPPSLNSDDLGVMEVTVPWGIDHVLCCCLGIFVGQLSLLLAF